MKPLRGAVARQAQELAWCPPEWREDYARFQSKGFTPDEARRIIEDHMAVIARRTAA